MDDLANNDLLEIRDAKELHAILDMVMVRRFKSLGLAETPRHFQLWMVMDRMWQNGDFFIQNFMVMPCFGIFLDLFGQLHIPTCVCWPIPGSAWCLAWVHPGSPVDYASEVRCLAPTARQAASTRSVGEAKQWSGCHLGRDFRAGVFVGQKCGGLWCHQTWLAGKS